MIVLGLETSCDETAGAAVEDGWRVRSNVVSSQAELHVEYGGVVPEIAGRAHAERLVPVVRRALADAGLAASDVDAIAVGHRPGLIGSLLVGVAGAKALAWGLGRPLVGVDHVQAHLHAALLGVEPGEAAAMFPAIGLVVSGGHTSLYRCFSPTRLERLGGTIDDALGEAYDKVATILGLPYPGGPALDRLASEPGADDRAHDFPVSRLSPGSLDFSFSGLKTSVLYAVRGRPAPRGRPAEGGAPIEPTHGAMRDVAASFQRAASEAVALKLERAIERARPAGGWRGLIAGGGVVANSRLRRVLAEVAARHGLALRVPAMDCCVDNAAMIAGLGCRLLEEGRRDDLTLRAAPTTAC